MKALSYMRCWFAFAAWLACQCFACSSAPPLRTRPPMKMGQLFPESIAIVVGFNSPTPEQLSERVAVQGIVSREYVDHRLEFADNDVRDMTAALKTQGYKVICCGEKYWIDAAELMQKIDTAITAHVTDETRVVVYMAGHGSLKKIGRESEGLFLLPSGVSDGSDLEKILSTNLRLQALATLVERSRAKHALLAIDACHAGAAAMRGTDDLVLEPPTLIEMAAAAKYPARAFLYASTADQRAMELDGHGLFTNYLLAGMAGGADQDRNGLVTFLELTQFVNQRVLNEVRASGQRPAYAKTGQGEVFFVNTGRRQQAVQNLDNIVDLQSDLPDSPGEFSWWQRAHEEMIIGSALTAALGVASVVSWADARHQSNLYEASAAPTPDKLATAESAAHRTRGLLIGTAIGAGVTVLVGVVMGGWNGRLLTW